MIVRQITRLIMTACLMGIILPSDAQQAPEPTKAPENLNPRAPATPADSSALDVEAAAAVAAIAKAKAAAAADGKSTSNDEAAIAKKAKDAGWRPEVHSGATVYCRQDAVVGSRFTQKRCATESQLVAVLERQAYEREQFKQRGCGGPCGGK